MLFQFLIYFSSSTQKKKVVHHHFCPKFSIQHMTKLLFPELFYFFIFSFLIAACGILKQARLGRKMVIKVEELKLYQRSEHINIILLAWREQGLYLLYSYCSQHLEFTLWEGKRMKKRINKRELQNELKALLHRNIYKLNLFRFSLSFTVIMSIRNGHIHIPHLRR